MSYDNTFILSHGSSNGLYYPILESLLTKKFDLIESNNASSRPSLIMLDLLDNLTYSKKYYDTPCKILNILNESKKIITDKYKLYLAVLKYNLDISKKYMARTWNTATFTYNSKHFNTMIVKPVGTGAFGGNDISIVTNKTEYLKAIHKVRKYSGSIISEYITNPYLFEGKKFHIRAYYLVYVTSNEFGSGSRIVKTKLFPFGKILTARLPYVNSDYNNKDIHDTHFDSTDRDIYFPQDLPTKELKTLFKMEVMPEMRKCMSHISHIISPVINKYRQSANGFEVFGCDFLVTTNLSRRVILLEINDKVGYLNASRTKAIELSKLYFNQLELGIFNPILKSNSTNTRKSKSIARKSNTRKSNTKSFQWDDTFTIL